MRYSILSLRGHSPLSFTGTDCYSGNGPEIALFEYQPQTWIAYCSQLLTFTAPESNFHNNVARAIR